MQLSWKILSLRNKQSFLNVIVFVFPYLHRKRLGIHRFFKIQMYTRVFHSSSFTVRFNITCIIKELLTFPEHLISPLPLVFSYSIFSFICMFCRSVVLLYFFFWPLCYLSFFYLPLLQLFQFNFYFCLYSFTLQLYLVHCYPYIPM